MTKKTNTIDYPLKIIQLDDNLNSNLSDLLKHKQENNIDTESDLNDNELQQTLFFIDTNDYHKYFHDTNNNFMIIDRYINVYTYENAIKLYQLFVNSKRWIIHGSIEYNLEDRVNYREEGNYLLLLDTNCLSIKNKIINGLRRLLDSFIANKKFLFEIHFEQILMKCFKNQLRIRIPHKINTSKIKCIKSNIIFSTLNSEPSFGIVNKQAEISQKNKFGAFFHRFRIAVANKMQNINMNIVTLKFSLNSLPHIYLDQENKQTYSTTSSSESSKLIRSSKTNSNIQNTIKTTPMSLSNERTPTMVNACSNQFVTSTPLLNKEKLKSRKLQSNTSNKTTTSSDHNANDKCSSDCDETDKLDCEVMCIDNMNLLNENYSFNTDEERRNFSESLKSHESKNNKQKTSFLDNNDDDDDGGDDFDDDDVVSSNDFLKYDNCTYQKLQTIHKTGSFDTSIKILQQIDKTTSYIKAKSETYLNANSTSSSSSEEHIYEDGDLSVVSDGSDCENKVPNNNCKNKAITKLMTTNTNYGRHNKQRNYEEINNNCGGQQQTRFCNNNHGNTKRSNHNKKQSRSYNNIVEKLRRNTMQKSYVKPLVQYYEQYHQTEYIKIEPIRISNAKTIHHIHNCPPPQHIHNRLYGQQSIFTNNRLILN